MWFLRATNRQERHFSRGQHACEPTWNSTRGVTDLLINLPGPWASRWVCNAVFLGWASQSTPCRALSGRSGALSRRKAHRERETYRSGSHRNPPHKPTPGFKVRQVEKRPAVGSPSPSCRPSAPSAQGRSRFTVAMGSTAEGPHECVKRQSKTCRCCCLPVTKIVGHNVMIMTLLLIRYYLPAFVMFRMLWPTG